MIKETGTGLISSSGEGTASAVPPKATKNAGFSPWGQDITPKELFMKPVPVDHRRGRTRSGGRMEMTVNRSLGARVDNDRRPASNRVMTEQIDGRHQVPRNNARSLLPVDKALVVDACL
jgi:hypothetical protein